ncbi:hypothetical protein F0P96_10505 [Hymenobacter busanensis]|uniref:Uncharacterized protein n=1 Tax=Hymenobacter busanensis TaxID=2607656 RepID=A0A7L4ZWQ1_9BACT|nr:phage terminase large subunit [Hymenobacter busanensis]KAA9333391.1 hypothetical protein F0P96_10505 [Hymenobacter busanensis]QHJ07929.1 hypothetical protein GUY19_11800 [Hymenobacter busanensis]
MERELELEILPDAVNERFFPLFDNYDRYLLLWGGRDSSKSDFVALKLLLDCLTLPYFKCIMARKIGDTVADSQWATLKAVAEREGIDDLFTWGISPCVIRCKGSKNLFVARGLDNPKKVKSTKDPTHAWYEEANEISEDDHDIVGTTLRTSHAGAVIQEVFTFNPDHQEDYKSFWIWKKFFDATGHANDTSFAGSIDVEVDDEVVRRPFTVLHSSIRDNRWAPKERVAQYKGYEFTNPYRYRVWYLGLWAKKETGNEFYPRFSRATHVKPTDYVPGVNILQSWDANSLPYCAMLCAQALDTRSQGGKLQLRVFREYALRSPNSGIRNTGRQFLLDRQAQGWQQSSVYLTGDASLRNRKVGEERESNFQDVQSALMGFETVDGNRIPGALHGDSADLWLRRNPNVDRRRDFINYLLAGGLHNVEVQIDPACTELIADLELTQKGIDGKLKEKYHDKVLGATYEIRGHFSDVFDYWLCTVLAGQYEAFKDGR